MKSPLSPTHISKHACILAAGLFIAAGVGSAGAQTLVYQDTFPGTSQNLDSAPTTGIIGLDGSSGGALPQSAAVESTIDGSGDLNLATPGGNSTGDTGYIRFDTVGSSSTLYNWATSPAASAIIAAGGMTVSFDWTANNTTSNDWLYFATGADPSDSFGYGYANVIWSSKTASGIILENNGEVQTFHSSSTAVLSGSFTPTGDSHVVTLTYDFTSWAAGAPVTLTATVDGNTLISNDSFVWNAAESGSNFFNLGTYQETNKVSNFQINTNTAAVPEPATSAVVCLGIAGLFAWRRVRAGRVRV
jgi:hypothetical protein